MIFMAIDFFIYDQPVIGVINSTKPTNNQQMNLCDSRSNYRTHFEKHKNKWNSLVATIK